MATVDELATASAGTSFRLFESGVTAKRSVPERTGTDSVVAFKEADGSIRIIVQNRYDHRAAVSIDRGAAQHLRNILDEILKNKEG